MIVGLVSAGMSTVVVQQSAVVRRLRRSGLVGGAGDQSGHPNHVIGRPVALADPGGFTVWRTGTPPAILLLVWAMLAVLRITRGDEQAGRWDLLLAGRCDVSRHR